MIDDADMPPPTDGVCGDAALYLLGMLHDGHARAFRVHADSCAVCREELGALTPAVDALGSRVPQLLAPLGVRRRVLDAVHADARAAPRGRARRLRERAASRALARRAAPALAAVALLAGGIAIGASSLGGGSGVATRAVRADVALAGASAVLHERGNRVWLTIAGLPVPGGGRVYEVWIRRLGGGAPQPTSDLFSPMRDGAATVAVPDGAGRLGEVMVTEERDGGSAVPTRAPVIVARL